MTLGEFAAATRWARPVSSTGLTGLVRKAEGHGVTTMQVYLDGTPLTVAGPTLAEAIDAALAHAGDRMVVEALADGEPVPPEHLDSPPDTSPYARELRFRSADRGAIARVALYEAADTLDQVRSIQADAADKVRAGHVDIALRTLAGALEGWSQVRSAIELMSTADLPLAGAGKGSDTPLDEQLRGLASALTELRRTIADSDWSALGDVLSYDLQERATTSARLLREAADRSAATLDQDPSSDA